MNSLPSTPELSNNYLTAYFRKSTNETLIESFNLETKSAEWNNVRITFIITLTREMLYRGWDIQDIISDNGFNLSSRIKLDRNKIQKIKNE